MSRPWALVAVLLAAVGATLSPVPQAIAAAPTRPLPALDCVLSCTGVGASGDAFDIVRRVGRSDVVPGRGDGSNGPAPGRTSYDVIDEHLAPTCSGNGLFSNDALCLPALARCGNDGRIAFWVWHRTTHVEVGPPEVRRVGEWRQEDGAYCLGADDAGVPTIAQVLAAVHAEFQRVPLPRFVLRSDPAPQTLVNLLTGFSAGSATPQAFRRQILGVDVHITATPRRWRWHFGDGATAVTNHPGRPNTTEVGHTFRAVGRYPGAHVEVTWDGTFTLGADPTVYPVHGTAVVRSANATVDVREARAELVSR